MRDDREDISDIHIITIEKCIVEEDVSGHEFAKTENAALADRIALDINATFGRKARVYEEDIYLVCFNKRGEVFRAEFDSFSEAETYASLVKARHDNYIQKFRGI